MTANGFTVAGARSGLEARASGCCDFIRERPMTTAPDPSRNRTDSQMFDDDEFFGSPETIALSRRSANLWSLLRDNPRYAYYGRLVALSDPDRDAADIRAAIATCARAGVPYFYPAN